ncbi:hypothetical protein DEU56DRAFT_799846 [Suillus clintonianus]|uniref:uncharacterized protein n=1 Tax=Suillus clintonianus TaxID=1904413 RepID=UPI001B85F3AE|nr:uncharacterized protein DEU56DRAFT_799846 [Suillus clintonianus]KAG2139718.1 hypothetical protein DEU56DRAFT_799846 [Suillus clintonianus]
MTFDPGRTPTTLLVLISMLLASAGLPSYQGVFRSVFASSFSFRYVSHDVMHAPRDSESSVTNIMIGQRVSPTGGLRKTWPSTSVPPPIL